MLEEAKTDQLTEVFNKFGQNMPTEISSALKEILEQNLGDINFADDMENKESTEMVIRDYMTKIAPTIHNLSKQISEILAVKIQTEYDAKQQQ